MTLDPAFRTRSRMMWGGLVVATVPVASFLVFLMVTVPAERSVVPLAPLGLVLLTAVLVTLRWPSVGGWLFVTGGTLVVLFLLPLIGMGVADYSLGSGMTLGLWLLALGSFGAALLIPIGGGVVLAAKGRHDRAMAAYAVNEGPTTVLTPDVVDQLNDLLALRENGEISAEEHERRAKQTIGESGGTAAKSDR